MKARNKILFTIISFLIINFINVNVDAITESEINFTKCTWNVDAELTGGKFNADGEDFDNITYNLVFSVGKSSYKDNEKNWKDSTDQSAYKFSWNFKTSDGDSYSSENYLPMDSQIYKYFDGSRSYSQCKTIYLIVDNSQRISTMDFYKYVTISENEPTGKNYVKVSPVITVSADGNSFQNYNEINKNTDSISNQDPCTTLTNGCQLYTTDNKLVDINFKTDLIGVCRAYINEFEIRNSGTSSIFRTGTCPDKSKYVVSYQEDGYYNISTKDATSNDHKKNDSVDWGDQTKVNCEGILGDDLIDFINKVFRWIQIIAPIFVIIMGSVDFAGAILQDDKDALKKASSKFVKRLIIAVALFFIPIILSFLLDIFNDLTGAATSTCGIGE